MAKDGYRHRHLVARRGVRVLFLVLCAGLTSCGQVTDTGALVAGTVMADPPLKTLDGASGRLSDYRGSIVVLNVWATWCGPCRWELPSLQSLADRLRDQGIIVIGVSVDDDPVAVKEYLIEQRIHFRNFIEPDGQGILDPWRISGFPTTYVIDRAGRLVKIKVGGYDWAAAEAVADLQKLLRISAAVDPAAP